MLSVLGYVSSMVTYGFYNHNSAFEYDMELWTIAEVETLKLVCPIFPWLMLLGTHHLGNMYCTNIRFRRL